MHPFHFINNFVNPRSILIILVHTNEFATNEFVTKQ